jgi:hypothetical protein
MKLVVFVFAAAMATGYWYNDLFDMQLKTPMQDDARRWSEHFASTNQIISASWLGMGDTRTGSVFRTVGGQRKSRLLFTSPCPGAAVPRQVDSGLQPAVRNIPSGGEA